MEVNVPEVPAWRQLARAGRELANRALRQVRRSDLVDGLTYAVTYRCNSRCTTCQIWQDAGDVPSELTLERLGTILDRSRLLAGLRYVNLTGGEPFLREDLPQIARLFLDRFPQLELRVPTNALLVSKTVDALARMVEKGDQHRVCLGISLDGLQAHHDQVRGVPGNFEKCVRLAETVRSTFPSIRVGVGLTVTPDNVDSILPVHDLALSLGVGFTCRLAQQSFYYQSDKPNSGPAIPPTPWTDASLDRARLALMTVRDIRWGSDNLFAQLADPAHAFVSQAVDRTFAAHRTWTCHSGTRSFFIDPFGKVFPCIMLDRPLGSLARTEFDDLFDSGPARTIRSSIARKECNCWTECETIPSIERSPIPVLFTPDRAKAPAVAAVGAVSATPL